jgi:hypothetical protein
MEVPAQSILPGFGAIVRGVPPRVPGQLEVSQTWNDDWRGWPVLPLHRQHPIRGSFLDPRPDPRRGAVYHNGIDIGVRDDIPGRGAPPGLTHRVHAIEGGRVTAATPRGVRGLVDAGHFRYEHIDARVEVGDVVTPGQLVGWTTHGSWHVHLSEFVFGAGGSRLVINPLRPGGKLRPYVDRDAPAIRELRFYAPATPAWGRRSAARVARLPQAGTRLDKSRLAGRVDVRLRADDPQSFIGWFTALPWLAAPHHPFRAAVTVFSHATGRAVVDRDVFRSEQLLTLPAGQHYAPGTEQNLPANGCMRLHRTVRCDGIYWFRLFPRPYWDTTRLPNGGYRIRVRVWDAAGNVRSDDTDVRVRN